MEDAAEQQSQIRHGDELEVPRNLSSCPRRQLGAILISTRSFLIRYWVALAPTMVKREASRSH
jgi:hypothetical protein